MACAPPQEPRHAVHWQALHWAAAVNAEEPIRVLLEHGAEPNVRTRRGEAPLHWAAKSDAARAVRALASCPRTDLLCRTR